ncbi:SDR family NAD(P)-dependent oxidoreductase [Sphingomonas sp. ASY06-1R]|uniref:SDR family NAD(P)-dependent oxidoreductase n=1 Tax=Sphingomonas sp. ASY06-1R TaxID=3445771 RepID=UPI003FA2BFDC
MPSPDPNILIAGASRGLGLALAAEFLARGWHVIGTVRGADRTDLHDLADRHPDRVEIAPLDITDPAQIAALDTRLAGRTLDMLFVNAGATTHDPQVTMGHVTDDEFAQVMATNVLGPMRVIQALAHRVPAGGLIGAMSSGQGSIANNENGRGEIYRSSKAALNMALRSFAARDAAGGRAVVAMAPGWIRTDLGGASAPFTMEEAIPMVADTLHAARATPGMHYLDRFGATVPW